MATQTKETEKKRKRRHIYVVCCCQCHQNYPSPCYGCHDIEGSRENGHVHKCRESPFREREVYRTNVNYAPPFEKEHKKLTTKQPTHLNKKFEPLYMTGLPIDDMLYHNKPFMKFGVPSQSYSWVHATKSDIWDQFSHTRSQEFSSPVSGKTYNISPTKIHNPEPELSQFNPLSIEAEMQNLKKIESDIKMDLKSRIMLDAVCDAILANDKEVDTSSSILLNEFISPNITQTEHIINDLYKSEQTRICSKLNETSLNGVRFENVMNNSNKKVNCETNTSRWSLNLGNQENNSPNYPNVHSPHMYTTENSCRRLFHNPFVSFDYNLVSNQNKGPHKLVDYSVVNNQPYITTKKELIPIRTKLIPTSKRSASPGIRAKDVKKVKLGKSSPLSNFHSTNTSDIFKKIDEIVSRSNVNKEMQSVLNTIPRTFQFFTSLEVSNLTKQNPPLQNNEVVNSCVIGMGEEKKERDDKTKALQMKKKKIYNRPSMIPKRVTDSKLNKKNASQ